jgi:hypothetical protein
LAKKISGQEKSFSLQRSFIMTVNNSQFATMLLSLSIVLTACSQQFSLKPTFTLTVTDVPTSTETLTPYPTLTSTPTTTFTPTITFTPTTTVTPSDTNIPGPASLAGAIFLSNDTKKPFVTAIELREKDSFKLIGKGKTDLSGAYNIANIQPGVYELWILVTTKPSIISGCVDIAPPDNAWRMGIKFAEDQALTMENAYLSKALLLAKNIESPDLKAKGFYAVLPNYRIVSGMINKMDVILICQ